MQEFLDALADDDGSPHAWRLPTWYLRAAAAAVEGVASLLGTTALLNRDILRMGMTSAVADTSRCRAELLPQLQCPTIAEGLRELGPP